MLMVAFFLFLVIFPMAVVLPRAVRPLWIPTGHPHRARLRALVLVQLVSPTPLAGPRVPASRPLLLPLWLPARASVCGLHFWLLWASMAGGTCLLWLLFFLFLVVFPVALVFVRSLSLVVAPLAEPVVNACA